MFSRAGLRFLRQVRKKWWLAIPFVIWEIIKDRLAEWANNQIDEKADTVMQTVVRIVEYVSSTPLGWTISIAIVVVVGLFIHSYWTETRKPLKIPSVDTDSYVPLKEAATIAYEEMRGTKAGTIIEGLNKDDVLGYYAHALFNGKTTLYGNHPPSRKLEAIPNEEYGRCGFSDDQNALHRHGENRNLYENLQIKRSDLDRRIAELKSATTPIILAELETTVSPIGDFTPACSIRVTNTGPGLEEKCLVQIENHGLKIHMPEPLVIRTEGQIRGKRTGRFTLSTGQPKLVPILFREPGRINQFRFIGEDGKHYLFAGDSAEFVVAIYGAVTPTKVRVRLSVGQDWKINSEMEYC